jgi:hypothetical protein
MRRLRPAAWVRARQPGPGVLPASSASATSEAEGPSRHRISLSRPCSSWSWRADPACLMMVQVTSTKLAGRYRSCSSRSSPTGPLAKRPLGPRRPWLTRSPARRERTPRGSCFPRCRQPCQPCLPLWVHRPCGRGLGPGTCFTGAFGFLVARGPVLVWNFSHWALLESLAGPVRQGQPGTIRALTVTELSASLLIVQRREWSRASELRRSHE